MNWERKLYDHEVQPPEGIWNRIQDNLDQPLALREKILSASSQPPALVWNRIQAALMEDHSEITPARRILLRPIFRVAAAAVLVGIMFWGAYTLFRSSSDPLPALNSPTSPLAGDQTMAPFSKPKPAMLSVQPTFGAAQLAMASLRSRRLKSPYAADAISTSYLASSENDKHWDYQSQELRPMVGDIDLTQASYPINLTGLVGNGNEEFFTIQGPNGEPIQVSAKFKDVIYFLNLDTIDEEQSDRLFSESKSWREKFKAWKEKMSQSSYTPDSGNFLDIAELIQLLKEEKNFFYKQYPLF